MEGLIFGILRYFFNYAETNEALSIIIYVKICRYAKTNQALETCTISRSSQEEKKQESVI